MKKSKTTENKPLYEFQYMKRKESHEKYLKDVAYKQENLKIEKDKPIIYNISSFDIETTGLRNDFYLFGYMTNEGNYIQTKSKTVAIDILNKLKNTKVYATNLGFDFNALSEGTDLVNKCKILIRGNNYITISWKGTYRKIQLYDSINYGGMSVESMGKILGIRKLKKPRCLGRTPKNRKEYEELEEYNKRDCEITKRFMELVQKTLNMLGGELKSTISSCALDLYRRKFLKIDVIQEKHFLKNMDYKRKIYKAYYGGRTEAFKRGILNSETSKTGKWYYGDVNSLYPSCMLEEYPVPMSVKYKSKINKDEYSDYLKYEGVSVFTINVPYMKYPPLPFRKDGKLVFPCGTLKEQSYTHLEIRNALKYGCEIIEMKEVLYYTETYRFFGDYVETLYSMRMNYKKEKSEMEHVIKLLLNSLYGRFALRNINKTEFRNMDNYEETLKLVKDCEARGVKVHGDSVGNVYFSDNEEFEGVTSYPIWSAYVTSYARIKIHDLLIEYEPVYCDTDSVITEKEVKDSKELGELKLEKVINNWIIIKPKLYITDDGLKCKGVPIPKNQRDKLRLVNKLLNEETIRYNKFIKVKEGISRNIKVNSVIVQEKNINLQDDKRIWKGKFNKNILEDSMPLILFSDET